MSKFLVQLLFIAWQLVFMTRLELTQLSSHHKAHTPSTLTTTLFYKLGFEGQVAKKFLNGIY